MVILDGGREAPVLLWQGEITAANVERVWQETRPHLLMARSMAGLGEIPVLRIDLAGVRFIDSSGLGLMIRIRKIARQNGSKVSFCNPQSAVSNVVRLARLEGWLFETEREEGTRPPAHALRTASVAG